MVKEDMAEVEVTEEDTESGDGKSAVATSDGKKPKEEKEARDYPIPLVHQ